jgi:hypothetical protein
LLILVSNSYSRNKFIELKASFAKSINSTKTIKRRAKTLPSLLPILSSTKAKRSEVFLRKIILLKNKKVIKQLSEQLRLKRLARMWER